MMRAQMCPDMLIIAGTLALRQTGGPAGGSERPGAAGATTGRIDPATESRPYWTRWLYHPSRCQRIGR
jgi:hypothetical protein